MTRPAPVAAAPVALAALVLLILLTPAGCGDGGPELHPVSGTVTFSDGEPIGGAVVEFLPGRGGPAARGRSDAAGRFTLRTGEDPGAVAGPHRVGVSRTVVMDGFGSHVRHMGQAKRVPPRAGSPATSGLTATVVEGENDIPIRVTPAGRGSLEGGPRSLKGGSKPGGPAG